MQPQEHADFETGYRESCLRDYADDRARSFGQRMLFAVLLVMMAWAAGDRQMELTAWLVLVLAVQAPEVILCRQVADGRAPAWQQAWFLRLQLASAAAYGVGIPIAMTSTEIALQASGVALGLGSMAAVAIRACTVPQVLSGNLLLYGVLVIGSTWAAAGQLPDVSLIEAAMVTVSWLAVGAQFLMTARRHSAQLRRLAEAAFAAQIASEAKDRFLATASHELRTPMNAIVGAADLLARQAPPDADTDLLETLRTASGSLVRHLDDLLDLARIAAGRIDFDPKPFATEPFFAQLRSLWLPRAQARGLTLTFEIAPSVPEGLHGDSHRLQQILSNLISNAVKFTESGGVTVSASRRDGILALAVRDTGAGLAPQEVARLFQPFSQATCGTAARHGGSGLGLSIARGLAARMGGSITLETRPGAGCLFWVRLPMAAAPAPQSVEPSERPALATLAGQPTRRAAPARVPRADSTALQVLVAEDNPASLQILCRYLDIVGVAAVKAVDGAEALEIAGLQGFDAIILDGRMPHLDGRDVARALREGTGPNASTPILMLSADASAADIEAGLAAGADAYLAKPVQPQELFDWLVALDRPEREPEAQPDIQPDIQPDVQNVSSVTGGVAGARAG